jgi:hypothetical protein
MPSACRAASVRIEVRRLIQARAGARVAKNKPSPSSAPVGLMCLRWGDGEPRILEAADQHVDGELRRAPQREDGLFRRAVLADLQELAADLVKLAADLADQVEPLRGQEDRPFRALAIELEQPDPALAAVRHPVDDVVERDLRDRLAASPDDRAASCVDDSRHARK